MEQRLSINNVGKAARAVLKSARVSVRVRWGHCCSRRLRQFLVDGLSLQMQYGNRTGHA